MPKHQRLKIADIAPDPILPPRINDPARLEALKDSMRQVGLLQPIVVRPPSGGACNTRLFRIADGGRRCVCAGTLGWDEIDVIVRDDLTDEEVLLLAYRAGEEWQPRSKLERAWYWAKLKTTGMLQTAIADREGVSEGTVSMYTQVGEVLSPERIEDAGVTLVSAAALPITVLSEIAKAPVPEIDGRLASAVAGDEAGEEDQEKPCFVWSKTARGTWKAVAREPDLASWSSEERVELVDAIGPLVTAARELEHLDSPEAMEARQDALDSSRREILRLREQHAAQVVELTDRVARLSRELADVAVSVEGPTTTAVAGRPRLVKALGVVRKAARRVRSWLLSRQFVHYVGSIFEARGSSVEEQLKIEFPVDLRREG